MSLQLFTTHDNSRGRVCTPRREVPNLAKYLDFGRDVNRLGEPLG